MVTIRSSVEDIKGNKKVLGVVDKSELGVYFFYPDKDCKHIFSQDLFNIANIIKKLQELDNRK